MGDLSDRYVEVSRWRVEDAAPSDRERPRSPGHRRMRFGDDETTDPENDESASPE